MDQADAQRFDGELRSRRLVAVTLEKEDAERHYEGYSNRVLWPLCHYLLEHVEFDAFDYEAYARVNERFADEVAKVAQRGDQIWIHDYHLMLLPALLRARMPQACIGFFLHIPFPSSEVFRLLPRKEDILRGLLGANLIGLHTYDYARHLISTLRRVLAVEFDEDWLRQSDGQCRVGVFPLGVDTTALRGLAASSPTQKRAERLKKQLQGRKVVLGVDRMDYTKGLPQRLDGFARLLQTRPEWREHAVFMQLAVPSRSGMDSYKQLKDAVDRRVGDINGRYQSGALAPIHYLYRAVPSDELAAMYLCADVMLVTPTRDGMNLVAKEYVASRQADGGVLVLSEFAGAAAEMGEALLINPYDADGIARELDRALSMSRDEMARRMGALRHRVAANTVHHWVERFLKALDAFALGQNRQPEKLGWTQDAVEAFAGASHALLALDYDGTLCELTGDPAAAAPPAKLLHTLAALGNCDGIEVAIISGRDPDSLAGWFSSLPIHLIAEHGFHHRLAGQAHWERMHEMADTAWKAPVQEILADYTARAAGSFIEEKPVSLVWHYRQAEHGFGQWMAHELVQHLSETFASSPLNVLHGNKVVEVRPQGFDKGRALARLLARLQTPDFVLAVGDDRTDEDMFVAAPQGAWTIKVGTTAARSHARHHLGGPAAVRQVLARMLACRLAGRAAQI